MSFLSILLFVSAIYFTHGRPDATATADVARQTGVADVLPDDSILTEPDEQSEKNLKGFIEAMSLAIDDFVLPMMPELTEDKQDQLKDMAMNGFGGFFNYIMLIYKTEDKNATNNFNDFSLERNDIILEFDSLEPLDTDSGLIPTITAPEKVSTAKAEAGTIVYSADSAADSSIKPASNI